MPDGRAMERAVALLEAADRPVVMAATNLYWGRGEVALRQLAEARGIPVFLNGMGRGCIPADHPLAFSRARADGLKGRTSRSWVNVVSVVGNNGIWALEKHPMELLYGYSVAAELRPGTRYDRVVEALPRRARRAARRRQARARPRVRERPARAGQRPHRPGGRLSAPVEPGVAC